MDMSDKADDDSVMAANMPDMGLQKLEKPDNMTEDEWRHAQMVAFQAQQFNEWQKQEYARWEKHRFFQYQLEKFRRAQIQQQLLLQAAKQQFEAEADRQMRKEQEEHNLLIIKILNDPSAREELVDKVEEEDAEL